MLLERLIANRLGGIRLAVEKLLSKDLVDDGKRSRRNGREHLGYKRLKIAALMRDERGPVYIAEKSGLRIDRALRTLDRAVNALKKDNLIIRRKLLRDRGHLGGIFNNVGDFSRRLGKRHSQSVNAQDHRRRCNKNLFHICDTFL